MQTLSIGSVHIRRQPSGGDSASSLYLVTVIGACSWRITGAPTATGKSPDDSSSSTLIYIIARDMVILDPQLCQAPVVQSSSEPIIDNSGPKLATMHPVFVSAFRPWASYLLTSLTSSKEPAASVILGNLATSP